MNYILIGRQIKNLRKENNLTMTNLAKKLNISQPTLSRIESGIQEVSFTLLESFCDEFNISVSEFFRKLEGKNEQQKIEINENDSLKEETLEDELFKMIATLSLDQKKALYVLLLPYIEV